MFLGTATTTSTLREFIGVCANTPDVQHRIQIQIDHMIGQRMPKLSDRGSLPLVEAAILETLRYQSIVPLLIPHMTTCDVEFHGYSFPKGTQVDI